MTGPMKMETSVAFMGLNGDLGKTPDGHSVDQLQNIIHQIQSDPHSRRHLVVAFNPGELDQMALPPCHAFFQFYVSKGRLSCQLYQRSADIFLECRLISLATPF